MISKVGTQLGPAELAANARRVIDTGAVGVNFEDQVVGGAGLFDIETQCARIAELRAVANAADVPLFINARTDVFFKDIPHERHADGLEDAIARAQAYARAGASGIFAPGLRDPALIRQICAASPLPVNMMVTPVTPHIADMGPLGVARISQGAIPVPRRDGSSWRRSEGDLQRVKPFQSRPMTALNLAARLLPIAEISLWCGAVVPRGFYTDQPAPQRFQSAT